MTSRADAAGSAQDPSRRALVWLGAICAGSVLLRALHLWAMAGDPLFDHPVIDPRENLERARQLAAGHWLGDAKAYWKPPLYDYFLAIHLRLFGASLWPPRVTQVVLDVASCVLAFRIGRVVVGAREGLIAAALLALSGPLIYHTGELTSASLAVMLELGLIAAALRARARPSRLAWGLAGVLLGVSALVRAEALLLGIWLLVLAWRSSPVRRVRLTWAALVCAGAASVIAPVALRNWLYAGDATLISANGGLNFYIGAEPRYHGVVGVRPGAEWEALVREPEWAGFRTASAQSRFFLRKGLARMADQPLVAAGHLARKLGHFWHGRELASNRDLYISRARSWVLAALLWQTPLLCFPFGVLAPLALAGAVLAQRARGQARVLIAPIAIHWVTVALFFVTGRHRLPVVGPLAVLAAYAVGAAIDAWRAGRRRRLAGAALAVAALAMTLSAAPILAADPRAYENELRAEEDHYVGTVLMVEQARPRDAMRALERALERLPTRASTWFNLGQAAEAAAEPARALAAFARSIEVAERASGERYLVPLARQRLQVLAEALAARPPGTLEPQVKQLADGVRCLDQGDWDCAERALGDHAALLAEALAARGHARLGAHDDARAQVDLARSAALRPLDAGAQLLYAIVCVRLGDGASAAAALVAFRRADRPRGTFLRQLGEADRGLAREAAAVVLGRFPNDAAALRLRRLLGDSR